MHSRHSIECEAEGTVIILEFDAFETESDYDYVKVLPLCKSRTFAAPNIPNCQPTCMGLLHRPPPN